MHYGISHPHVWDILLPISSMECPQGYPIHVYGISHTMLTGEINLISHQYITFHIPLDALSLYQIDIGTFLMISIGILPLWLFFWTVFDQELRDVHIKIKTFFSPEKSSQNLSKKYLGGVL